MHYPISVTRKPFGLCFALLLLSLIVAVTISTALIPTLHRYNISVDTVNLHNTFNTIYNSKNTELPGIDPLNLRPSNATAEPQPELDQKQAEVEEEPLCIVREKVDHCEMEGDVRVDSNSSTVFLIRPRSSISHTTTTSWTINPYPRKSLTFIKNWTVRLAADDSAPKCTKTHPSPALLFCIGGFTENHYHDYADVLFPLFTTTFHLKRDVRFLTTDTKPRWLSKYHPLLHQLTKHHILDIDREKHDIHCYSKLTVGLRIHRDLLEDPTSGVSMSQFRRLLRRTYSLDRETAVALTEDGPKPRLLIVSRKRSRILLNEAQVSRLATNLGYEVVLAECDSSKNYTKFAQLVNSCDVMMGIHGAGLTNMLFLPDQAVLVQIVPFGPLGVIAWTSYEKPSVAMNLRYLNYKIELNESSLFQQYPIDHPVIKHPMSIRRQGFDVFRKVYLHNQNVTINVARFRHTLVEALELLVR